MADRLTSLALQHAVRRAGEGELEGALELIEQLEATLEETPPEVVETRKSVQRKLLDSLRSVFSDGQLRFVGTCASNELRKYHIRSKEAYFWTQCDGVTTLSDLIALGPDELDALRSLQKLLSLGLLQEQRSD